MREYIFRGKRVDNDDWIEGYLVICDERYFIMPENAISCFFKDSLRPGTYVFGEFIEVTPNIVGQFTGLYDLNGKKIFEGDILQRKTPKEYWSNRMYVVWRNGGFELWDFEENIDFPSNWCSDAYRNGENIGGCYVIGNMIDNQNLMKGDQQ